MRAGRFHVAGGDRAGLSVELEAFLAAGDAPIVFTPGTGHRHAAAFFDAALLALRRLGRRGIFVTPHAAQLPPALPDSVLWQAHAPFAALLPRVAALAHHGGVSTTADAMRAGIPQLIVPFAYDQFDNGLRAKRLGVAEVLLARRLSGARMHERLRRLLAAPSVRQSCRELAARMAGRSRRVRWIVWNGRCWGRSRTERKTPAQGRRWCGERFSMRHSVCQASRNAADIEQVLS